MDPVMEPDLPMHFSRVESGGLGSFNSVNASAILEQSQRHTIQVLATVTSSISLATAACAMFWFFMMRRNFRRDLVLLLIASGFWKSLWFVIFPAVTFAEGQVQTNTAFCQASGYCLQVGFEACDISVLFMSMHMYYQIFPPINSFLGHDGLYRIRHWVIAAWAIFPNLSAGLAFVNPRAGYMAQGAFCSIPLRPFWYRLALFWIPRYLVWIYVIFVAVRIHRHVGSEFKVFGQERASESNSKTPGVSISDQADKTDDEGRPSRKLSTLFSSTTDSKMKSRSFDEKSMPDDVGGLCTLPKVSPPDSVAAVPINSSRRQSTPNWSTTFDSFGMEPIQPASASRSTPSSRRGSHQVAPDVWGEDFAPQPAPDSQQRRGSVASVATKHSSMAPSEIIPPLPTIRERDNGSLDSTDQSNTPDRALRQRRRAITRQLRLLFIYPCVYMILWTIPFVVNIMNYTNYYAQHPIYALQIVQVFMLTIMTTADVVIFCWRERPWRHIPGSDGTFLGSFMWWRYCFGITWMTGRRASRAPSLMPDLSATDGSKTPYQSGILGSLKSLSIYRKLSASWPSTAGTSFSSQGHRRPPHIRAFSGMSDRKQAEAERAHQRLAMERAEYEQRRQSFQEKRASAISASAPVQTAAERKEWFDRHDSDLFTDHEPENEQRDDIV